MAKLKVVVTDYVEQDMKWEEEQFKRLGIDFSHNQLKLGSSQQILDFVEEADIVIVNMAKLDAEVIAGLRRCKLIIRHGVGYDNVDIEAATKRHILLSYVPDYCMEEVAEQTIMLMFACQRKLQMQNRLLRESAAKGKWIFDPIYPLYRFSGKTLGIIGFGRIGSTVYQMLQGFGMHFLVHDPYLSEARRREYGIEALPLNHVLKEADIVTIHTPLSKTTYHLIDEPQLKLMKKSAILVNTARGGVVNLRALDKALNEGWIANAGIDVFEEKEPPDPDFPLLHNERAICTPHLSWLSEEAGWSIREKIVEDVRRFLQRQGPRYPVNSEVTLRFD